MVTVRTTGVEKVSHSTSNIKDGSLFFQASEETDTVILLREAPGHFRRARFKTFVILIVKVTAPVKLIEFIFAWLGIKKTQAATGTSVDMPVPLTE
jgi:hypothetical protein